MSTANSRVSLILGVGLILLGGLFLLEQLINIDLLSGLWPFILIAAGLAFFVAMVAGGKAASPLAIPGSIITTIGLITLVLKLLDHAEAWSYAWTVILMGVGAGIAIHGWWGERPEVRERGLRLVRLGAVLLVIFGAFFELVVYGSSQTQRWGWPALLIALGLFLLVRRSGLLDSVRPRAITREARPEQPRVDAGKPG